MTVIATGREGSTVAATLHLSSGGLAAAIATGATTGTIGGATYGFTESLLFRNDAATVAKDTVIGGVSGGATGGILAGAAYGIQKGASAIGNAIKGKTPPTQAENSVLDGACFIAGTKVLTALRQKAIENIQPGDKVLAADPETGRQEEKEVVRTFVKETDTLMHLRIGGEEIVTTENHPFYVDGEGWVTAGELTEEDCVLDSEGCRLQVEEKYVEKLEESVKVYNFEVEEYHTYYVGDAGILVHNKCWDDVPPKKTSKNVAAETETKTYPLENGPYIRDGKPYGRPKPSGERKKKFEETIYNISEKENGMVKDANGEGYMKWKPGESRKDVIDFGHKKGKEYHKQFLKYKNGEISVEGLREHEYNPDNFQLEVPSSNRSHRHEKGD